MHLEEGSMAEVLALSDDEDTPRKPSLRPGTRPFTPITPGNVVCLDSDDEAEVKVTPKARCKGSFLDLDDCSIVSVTPASAKAPAPRLDDCTIIREVPSSSKKTTPPRMPDPSIIGEVPSSSKKTTPPRMPDPSIIGEVPSSSIETPPPRMPSIVREAPSSSIKTPPRVPDPSTIRGVPSSSMKTPPRMPDPYESQIPTDWTPHWSPDWSPEVEEPQAKKQRCDAASPPPDDDDDDDDPVPAHDLTFSDDPTPPDDPTPARDLTPPCDPTLSGDVDMSQRSGSRGRKGSEEERQRRLREKELELERKQAEREAKKREKEEAKRRLQEEIKQKKEDEKARKAAAKKAAAERRKAEQDAAKFKSKEVLKEMVASVDPKVVEKGLIGGHLLSRFAQRNLTLKVEKNPLESSITLRTKRPILESQESEIGSQDDDVAGSQVIYEEVDVQYLIFIFEAEEFSTMVAESALYTHVRKAQVLYPGYTICYVVNKLTAFLKKKDQGLYQSPHDPANSGWKRPPVEKAVAGLLTNFTDVHSRMCIDEAEVADHVTELMPVLAKSYHKPKLSKFSVLKNGDHVRHDDAFKEEIRGNSWLKVLVAIPKVSGPCAVSIGKMYPTMRSLYSVYLDKQKTEREKELLLQNLQRENVFGSGSTKIGPVCSKRIFHVLMAQDGNLKVDNIEAEVRGGKL